MIPAATSVHLHLSMAGDRAGRVMNRLTVVSAIVLFRRVRRNRLL